MTGQEWMPGADRDPRAWACYRMSRNTTSRRVGLHWTASPRTASPMSQADYMWQGTGNTGYHLLVPVDDNGHRPLQLRGASCGAGSLSNTGELHTSPNKQGTINIQVSMICTTGDDPFVKGPGPWWPDVLAWLDSWGVPREYVAGPWNITAVMATQDWYGGSSGYYAHKNCPEIPGTPRKPDPGPVEDQVLWAAPPPVVITSEEKPMLVMIRNGNGTVYLLSGGRLVTVRSGASLPELEQVTGPIVQVDSATFDSMLAAYGQPT